MNQIFQLILALLYLSPHNLEWALPQSQQKAENNGAHVHLVTRNAGRVREAPYLDLSCQSLCAYLGSDGHKVNSPGKQRSPPHFRLLSLTMALATPDVWRSWGFPYILISHSHNVRTFVDSLLECTYLICHSDPCSINSSVSIRIIIPTLPCRPYSQQHLPIESWISGSGLYASLGDSNPLAVLRHM